MYEDREPYNKEESIIVTLVAEALLAISIYCPLTVYYVLRQENIKVLL